MKAFLFVPILGLSFLAACSSKPKASDAQAQAQAQPQPQTPIQAQAQAQAQAQQAALPRAEARLTPKNGSNVSGTVLFQETAQGLLVSYNIAGLQPNQQHGFHVHERGDCSAADAKSAGQHFAPVSPSGGTAKDSPQQHAGDFPEVQANAAGRAQGSFLMPWLSVGLGKYSISNRAVIVHAGQDNPMQPSQARIACGVIQQRAS